MPDECARCARSLAAGRRYLFGDGQRQEVRCLGCALCHGPMLRKALGVAAVVGTILTAINQGDLLLSGSMGTVGLVKIALTYSVPFCVSVYSVLAMNREKTVRPGLAVGGAAGGADRPGEVRR